MTELPQRRVDRGQIGQAQLILVEVPDQLEEVDPRYALLLVPGKREGLSPTMEAVLGRGGEVVERIPANPVYGADAGFGPDRSLGRYRWLAVALTASAIGPEIDVYAFPD